MLDCQFQPLALSNSVGPRPIAATVAGEQFVLFRDERKRLAVFVDRCPHRGMQLSCGTVENGLLTCPYHGWQFDADGAGRSPGNRFIKPRAERMDVKEAGGVIWIRRPSPVDAALPDLDVPGYQLVHRAFRDIDAPMLVVLDNFTEIEHTGTGHWEFGFGNDRLAEVSFRVEDRDGRAAATAIGYQKPLSLPSRLVLGVATGDRLTITIDTAYAPLHVTYEWWWEDAQTGAPKGFRFKEIAFFTPLDEQRSRLVAFYYWTMPKHGRFGLNRAAKIAAARVIGYEIELDVALCSSMTPGSETLERCHLTRFDALLPVHRRHLDAKLAMPARAVA